jgi:histidine kinase
VDLRRPDEMGLLAGAINQMSGEIAKQQSELNKQRDEYQNLFESVPCLITVQDCDYRLLRYNNEFARRFAPQDGDYCYHAYKNRDKRCVPCPVEKTFADGLSHKAEESGVNKDGTPSHWIVRTSPIRDDNGRIVAAMEISHDITERRQLEIELEKSEENYHAVFSNIPNPVFVLTQEDFTILDCNHSVLEVYGYHESDLVQSSFLDLFLPDERTQYSTKMATAKVLNQVRHLHRSGRMLFVNIRISPSKYSGRSVLLITISDITKRLEAEQQLIQASKMATLGEMATGVAHELNQPLAVIKTASGFFMRKLKKNEPIKNDILLTMAAEIDSHVHRASRIINHMRQFGRKTDLTLERVQINDIMRQAFEIFSQQLKVRGIRVDWVIDDQLPEIMGDSGRLEQVMINLLINARDAIEERWEKTPAPDAVKCIRLISARKVSHVVVEVCDSGVGISEHMREKIFEPFFTTKKVGQGTGLGLSISYGIIQECNGKIFARSNPEGGACFVIEFPIPEDE